MNGTSLRPAVRYLVLPALLLGTLAFAPQLDASANAGPSRDVVVAGGPGGAETQRLVDRLGEDRTAGFVLDQRTKRFVVSVTDQKAADVVREAGAVARVVEHDIESLDSIKRDLDATFRTPGTMWGVDVPANQVVVRADDTVSAKEIAEIDQYVAPFGDAVRVVSVGGETRQTMSSINGGDYIEHRASGSSCSYGFTVRSKSDSSAKSILTAGHCTELSGNDWEKSDGTYIGFTTGRNVANGNDFGLIRAFNDREVTYYGNVEAQNGDSQDIVYSRDSRLNERVCASGYNSKYGCGNVLAKNQTINYSDGSRVTGMDITNICRKGGDSGGPMYAGDAALGLLSGGSTSRCESYFQPVNEALAWYGMEVF